MADPFERVRAEPGVAGLYLFAATMHASRILAVLGCVLMGWGLWREREFARPVLAAFAPARWLLALATLAGLRALLAGLEAPAFAVEHFKAAARFVYFLGLLPVAWYLAGNERRLLRVLAVALVAFVFARLTHLLLSVEFPLDAWLRRRPGLGLEPIALGYYAGCALVGMLILLPRFLAWLAPGRRPPALAAVLATVAFLALLILWSQSRGAWLSVAPCLLLAVVWLLGSGGSIGRRPRTLLTLLAALVLVAVALSGRGLLSERLDAETQTIRLALRGDWDAIRSGDARGRNYSLGTRINMLRAGVEAGRQRPWLGHGPAAPELLLAAHPDRVLRRWNDFHSAPVDLFVRFGLIGLVIFLGAMGSTLACGLDTAFRRVYGLDVRLLLGLASALLVLSSLSNFRLLNYDWRYWLFLIAGAMLSPALARRRAARAPVEGSAPTAVAGPAGMRAPGAPERA